MIVCRKCSRRCEDGTEFCSCGAYLAFDGEHVDGPADPVRPSSDANPPTANPGPARPTSDTNPPAASPGPTSTASTEPAPWGGLPGDTRWQTASPDDSTVAARLPDTPNRPETTAPVWVEQPAREGDVLCRNCATANAPSLQFCRHCGQMVHGGEQLTAASGSHSRPSWWRRVFRRAGRSAEQVDPMRLGGSARRLSSTGIAGRVYMFRGGALVFAALGLLAFLGPWRTPIVNAARDALGGERFDSVDRSDFDVATIPEPPAPVPHPAENVADSFANTTWATNWIGTAVPGSVEAPGDGSCLVGAPTDTALRFTFDGPTEIAKVAILGGRREGDASAGLFSRPRLVELAVDGRCEYLGLAADGKLEIHGVELGTVLAVDLRVVDIHAEPEQAPTVEIAEVIFGQG